MIDQNKKDKFFYRKPDDGSSSFHNYLRKSPNTLCMYPFHHINFRADDTMSPCFRTKGFCSLNDTSPREFWNSEKMKSLRMNMINGVRDPVCEACWSMEERGSFSYRQESLKDFTVHAKWRSQFDLYDEESGEMPFEIKQSELRFSNQCNLKCRMCSPVYSTKWEAERDKASNTWRWLQDNGYHKKLKKTRDAQEKKTSADNASRIVQFTSEVASSIDYLMITGGEPFIDTSHVEALKRLSPYAQGIILEYTTNLNTLTKNGLSVLDLWKGFKQVRLKVSIDGDPEIYNYIRHGGSIEKVCENIKKVYENYPILNNKLYKHYPSEKVVIVGTCTVSIYNIERLDVIANFITSLGCLFHTSQVDYPAFMSTGAIAPKAKDRITKRLTQYLDQLEERIVWGDHPLWLTEEAREIQVSRVYRYILNSIQRMNGGDFQGKRDDLFSFEKVFNQDNDVDQCIELDIDE